MITWILLPQKFMGRCVIFFYYYFFYHRKNESPALPSSAFKAELNARINIYTQMVFCPPSSTDFNLLICNCLDTFLLPFISIISDCISYLETGALRLIQKLFLKEIFLYTVSRDTAFVTDIARWWCWATVTEYYHVTQSFWNVCFMLPKKKKKNQPNIHLIKPHDHPH